MPMATRNGSVGWGCRFESGHRRMYSQREEASQIPAPNLSEGALIGEQSRDRKSLAMH